MIKNTLSLLLDYMHILHSRSVFVFFCFFCFFSIIGSFVNYNSVAFPLLVSVL